MSSSLKDLYQEIILDHSRNPKNFGLLEEYDRRANGINPLCGDKVTIFLKLVGNVIGEAKFDARGCAISIASASMMTEMVKGKSIDEAKNLFEKFTSLVTGQCYKVNDLEELETLSGVKDFPTRIKCATLPWHAMVAAIEESEEAVKTE